MNQATNQEILWREQNREGELRALSTNSIIDQLELELTALASRWRYLHSRQFFSEAEAVVQEYHAIVAKLWALGWDGRGMPLDSELPDRLMPDYYIAYWHDKSQQRQSP